MYPSFHRKIRRLPSILFSWLCFTWLGSSVAHTASHASLLSTPAQGPGSTDAIPLEVSPSAFAVGKGKTRGGNGRMDACNMRRTNEWPVYHAAFKDEYRPLKSIELAAGVFRSVCKKYVG